jgi:nucleoside-diphosphate-sugar epimerase
MRLDVAVNLLTFQGLSKKEITVFGGDQTRPNIHIDDMVAVYDHFISNPDIPSGYYNAGFENLSILQIANMIKEKTDSEIIIQKSNDPRSYNQCSEKLISTGFKPTKNVENAIDEMIDAYRAGKLTDREQWHTVKRMKKLNVQ